MSAKIEYIPALDGLRAVSILLVGGGHLNWLPGGAIGVDIFFVISGYLITSILVREFDSTGRISVKSFYVRRILRIVPAFAVLMLAYAVAITAAAAPEQRPEHYLALLYAATYTMNWARALGHESGIIGHTWSLAVEEQFYLVWPLALFAILFLPRRKQLAVVAALIAVPTVWRAWLISVGHADWVFFGSDARANELFIGCLLALLPMRMLADLARKTWLVPAGVLAVLAAVGLPAWLHVVDTLIVALSAAWLIAAIRDDRGSILSGLLGTGPCVVVGRLSYSLYLWHYPIIVVLAGRSIVSPGLLPLVAIPLSLAVAALSYSVIEKPFLRLKARQSDIAVRQSPEPV